MIHQGSAGTRGARATWRSSCARYSPSPGAWPRSSPTTAAVRVEQVAADIDRDYFMTPEEAMAYGLIDGIVEPRRGLAAPVLAGAVG